MSENLRALAERVASACRCDSLACRRAVADEAERALLESWRELVEAVRDSRIDVRDAKAHAPGCQSVMRSRGFGLFVSAVKPCTCGLVEKVDQAHAKLDAALLLPPTKPRGGR